MALTSLEIAVGGIASIPVVAGSVFLGFKTFGEKALDPGKTAKQKTIKKAIATSEKPVPINQKSAVSEKKSPPAKEKTALAEKKSSPAKEKTALAEKNSASAKEKSVNVTQKTAAAKVKTTASLENSNNIKNKEETKKTEE